MRTIVFTDLDGTLLDHATYEPGPALGAIRRLQDAEIPVVFCSAKTAAEQCHLRRELGVLDPFIVENGAAVFPPGPCPAEPIAVFGVPASEVRARLERAAGRCGVTVTGYGDMTVSEVASATGLEIDAAMRARDRDYTETFVLDDGDPERLARELAAEGLRLQRGARFWTAQGDHDKGIAVRWLAGHLSGGQGERTYGLGDHLNDADMLRAVRLPMLVQRPDGSWIDVGVGSVRRIVGVGPEGWAAAAAVILAECGIHT